MPKTAIEYRQGITPHATRTLFEVWYIGKNGIWQCQGRHATFENAAMKAKEWLAKDVRSVVAEGKFKPVYDTHPQH